MREIGVGKFVGGFEVNADAVGNGETRILAHVLDAIDELTGQAFVDQFRRERRIQGDGSPSAGFHQPALDALRGDRDVFAN